MLTRRSKFGPITQDIYHYCIMETQLLIMLSSTRGRGTPTPYEWAIPCISSDTCILREALSKIWQCVAPKISCFSHGVWARTREKTVVSEFKRFRNGVNGYRGLIVSVAIVPVSKYSCYFDGYYFLSNLPDPFSGDSFSGMNKPHPIGSTASHEALNQCDWTVSGLLQDDADHLIAYARCFWKSRLKVFRDAFEAILVRREIAKGDALRPSTSGKRKL